MQVHVHVITTIAVHGFEYMCYIQVGNSTSSARCIYACTYSSTYMASCVCAAWGIPWRPCPALPCPHTYTHAAMAGITSQHRAAASRKDLASSAAQPLTHRLLADDLDSHLITDRLGI